MKKLFCSILLLVIITPLIYSQGWHTYTVTNTNGKLPDNNVECLAVDANGVLWLGTYFSGLVKFDGTSWTSFNKTNSPLKDNIIIDIAIDKQNNLWVANYANGVFRFNPATNTWTQFTKESGALTNNYTHALEVDNQGNVWVAVSVTSYTDPGVVRYNGSSWINGIVFKDSFSSYAGESIAVDKSGNVWCGSRIGLYKYDGTNWSLYTKENTQNGLGGNYVRTIACDASGNVWVGTTDAVNNQTAGGGLTRFNGTSWTIYKSSTHQIDDFVSAIAFRNNDVWIGTGFCGQIGNYKGVYIFNGTTFIHNQSSNTFPGNCVNDMVVDKNGNVWIGSAYGLTKYGTIVSVEDNNGKIPSTFSLDQNYPNPFNPSTTIKYQIQEHGFVTLKVYNAIGKEVAVLVNEEQESGNYKVSFDSKNLASGIYFYRLESGSFSQTKKLTLVK